MHPHAQLLETFYSAFQKLDGDTMASCYHDDVEFSDPVFPELRGKDASGMWRMLCSQATNFELTYDNITADDERGSAHWEAKYTFSVTGRSVHNKIDAEFRFKDGKIVNHHDTFDFYAWSRMALGTPGLLLGWSPIVKNKVRGQAATNLSRYMAKNG